MSRNRFIQGVRQYQRLADRKHKSFGEQVQAFYDIRISSIIRDYPTEDERFQEIEWTNKFIMRNYAGFDQRWTFRPANLPWTTSMG